MHFEGSIDDEGVQLLAAHEAGEEFYAEITDQEYGLSLSEENPDTLAEHYDQFRTYLETQVDGYELRPHIELRDGREEDTVSYSVRYRVAEPRLPGDFSMQRGEIARIAGDVPQDLLPELDAYVDGDLTDALEQDA